MKILLIRLDHLGDLVLMTPLVRALAKAGHEVELMTPRWLGGIFEGNGWVAKLHLIEEVAPGFPRDWRGLGKWMKAGGYEAVLLPNSKPKELLWSSFFSGAKRRVALQAGVWGRLTFHECLGARQAFAQGRHYADIQLDLARALGVEPDGIKPDYFLREEEVAWARKKVEEVFPGYQGEALIGIHPGCAGNTCNLPSAVYGELAKLVLKRTEARIVVTGSEREKALPAEWPRAVLESPRVFNGMGALKLRELGAMLSLLNRYVIPSTGPLHLASAIGVRTVSPFCAIPPLCAGNWGNAAGMGCYASPTKESCRKWMAEKKHFCDYRGEVTAEMLWRRLTEEKSVQGSD